MEIFIQIVSWFATIVSCIRFIPQLIKIIVTKSSKDVSLIMYIIAVLAALLWLIAAVMIMNYPLIVTNVIVFIIASFILTFKIWEINKSKKRLTV